MEYLRFQVANPAGVYYFDRISLKICKDKRSENKRGLAQDRVFIVHFIHLIENVFLVSLCV